MAAAGRRLAVPLVASSVTRLVVRPHHRSSGHYFPRSQRPFALMCRNFGQHLPRPLFGRHQLSWCVPAQCKVLGLHVGHRYCGAEPDCDFPLDKRSPCSCISGKGFFRHHAVTVLQHRLARNVHLTTKSCTAVDGSAPTSITPNGGGTGWRAPSLTTTYRAWR